VRLVPVALLEAVTHALQNSDLFDVIDELHKRGFIPEPLLKRPVQVVEEDFNDRQALGGATAIRPRDQAVFTMTSDTDMSNDTNTDNNCPLQDTNPGVTNQYIVVEFDRQPFREIPSPPPCSFLARTVAHNVEREQRLGSNDVRPELSAMLTSSQPEALGNITAAGIQETGEADQTERKLLSTIAEESMTSEDTHSMFN